MKGSSSGQYYEKLDHVRALAAFLVFSWHTTHMRGAIPPSYVPSFPPVSLFEEGHIGVALFMTLSGYLFAKIINGRPIDVGAFLYNRILRLFPLLFVTLAVGYGLLWSRGMSLETIFSTAYVGFIFPRWPNGAWSIAVELHFYLLLPILLPIAWKHPQTLLALIVMMIFIRAAIYLDGWNIRNASYWTIIGRIDQFLAGMAAFCLLKGRTARSWYFAVAAVAFIASGIGSMLKAVTMAAKAAHGGFVRPH
ncbi:acyltransferase family protein [Nitratireductor kimnyeongensis]|uniref:Acyltransferase family protein n=1 Tax=Nitratireductor kimnyeongensis TaxID=430679 RepID=A0ABW0T3Z4_9HYPH|nr:acyltransferase [Nitratireductor kimnyeongensis]QZZ35262.1 acyltransferase [Nitratireductor kimnyeongensis]